MTGDALINAAVMKLVKGIAAGYGTVETDGISSFKHCEEEYSYSALITKF